MVPNNTPVIAVVEDNPADAELLRFALQQTGIHFEIIVLKDGAQALHYLEFPDRSGRSPVCDLMFMDLNVPVVNGFEVLEEMRSHEELRQIPVIVMSGSENQEDVNRCYRAGANSYISKANDIDEILAKTELLVSYWFKCVKLPVLQCVPAPLER